MKALILVDIQNDFLPGGALAVPNGHEIVPIVNELVNNFPLVIATQDWHPANHGSFASVHPGKRPFELAHLAGLPQVLWPNHCVQGTTGAEFSKDLSGNCIEAIFRKGTDRTIDSYSGFFDNGKKKATGMGSYLKGVGVEHIFVVGLAGDYCVGYTALDALEMGFMVTIVEDAIRSIDANGWVAMKQSVINHGGQITTSTQLL